MGCAIGLYGKMLAFSRLTIMTDNWDRLKNDIQGLNNTQCVPVVVESEYGLPLDELITLLWEHNIAVIGVMDGVLAKQAKKRQMAVFPADGKRIHRLDSNTSKDTSALDPIEASEIETGESKKPSETAQKAYSVVVQGESTPIDIKADDKADAGVVSRVHHQMVRSGQSIHYIGGDLVITGSVNVGAEVATDHNLHIYGKGQGRLVAGATGDENARIFCQKFDPSLVSVAGRYCLKDDIPSELLGSAVEVRFDKDKGLVFSKMTG